MKMLRVAVLFMLCGSVSYGLPASAVAQFPCTAVIYLFRHAEDADQGDGTKTILDGVTYYSKLLPWGEKHADLYNDMITSLGTLFNGTLCPVGKVYTVSPTKPNGDKGTTNPYKTAEPLALIATDAYPTITIGSKRIGEFLNESQGVTPDQLHADYAPILNDGLSVAFFWTSQGLPNLALAINSAFPIPFDSDANKLRGTRSLCISSFLAFLIRSEPENPPTPAATGLKNTDNVLTIIPIGHRINLRINLVPRTAQPRNALENFTVLTAANYPPYLTLISGS